MEETNTQSTSEPPEASSPEKKEEIAPEEKVAVSREPLFGIILLGIIVIFLLLAAAGIGWAIYGGVSKNQAEKNEPSITSLGKEEKKEVSQPVAENTAPAPTSPNQSASDSSAPAGTKTTTVSVLNGGAAGGSAGKLATALKQEGYSQVTAGDTTGNYTGVVIYYADSAAKEAETLKTAVAKTYPNVTVAKAIAANKETSTSPLTVIIGK